MGTGASSYERELKGVLQGEPEALRRYRREAGSLEELSDLDRLAREPFLVVRAAGSQGFDLVALRDRLILPIEVKSSASPQIHFSAASGRASEQYRGLLDQTRRAGLVLFYAYRRVGLRGEDPWRIFSADPEGSMPRSFASLVHRYVPPVSRTTAGHEVLRWEEGRPLLKVLAYLSALSTPSSPKG